MEKLSEKLKMNKKIEHKKWFTNNFGAEYLTDHGKSPKK